MIRGIIFDCFGVLAQGSLSYFSSITPPEHQQALHDVNGQADLGLLSHQEYIEAVSRLAGVPESRVERAFAEKHILDEALMNYARSLKPEYKIAMLSNVGYDVINRMFTAEQLGELFDAVVLSAEVGMVKPNPKIFELTATRLGLLPEECIMIDDIAANVDGAIQAGMQGVTYTSIDQLKRAITELTAADGHA